MKDKIDEYDAITYIDQRKEEYIKSGLTETEATELAYIDLDENFDSFFKDFNKS